MTNAEQTAHWLKFHRFQQRYEGIYTPKFNAAIRSQINDFIETGTLMSVFADGIYKVLHSLYTESAYIWAHRATQNLRKERLTMGFSQRIIDLMKTYYGIDLLNLADDLTQTTKDVIQRVLSEAAVEGFGFDEVVNRLRNTELTVNRARLIARTETVAAANAASNVAAQDSGLIMDKIWISARDNRVRLHHAEVNQHIVKMDQTFTVGFTQMKFPGDKNGGAAECCNCFLPNELTSVNPEIIKKAFRSFYDGKVITIKGANGKAFTCTPNHPILTTNGFIAAGKLTEFDKLVYSDFINKFPPKDFNINNGIATFEEIYNSLYVFNASVRVDGTIMDFYGDGSTSDVDIISTDSQLHNGIKINETIINELFQNSNFRKTDLLTNCSKGKPFNSLLFSAVPHSNIGTFSEPLPLFKRGLSHSRKHTFTPISDGYTCIFESESDNISTATEVGGNSFNGFAGIKHFNGEWNVNNCGYISALSHGYYKGYVYTFETTEGIYDVNSFVAKNCRCTHAFIPRRDANGRLIRA